MTPDELKSLPKGTFVVSKTGAHPMKTKLKLFLEWGIRFENPYTIAEKAAREVKYADKQKIEEEIVRRYECCVGEDEMPMGTDKAKIQVELEPVPPKRKMANYVLAKGRNKQIFGNAGE